MLGKRKDRDNKLFYQFDLDGRVPADHPLRRIEQTIDFSFVRTEVASLYGNRGNESIDPIVLLKLMLICFLENISSERELTRQLPFRLDWLWFCHYGLDEQLPNHSVLSKARRRWGMKLFSQFFKRVLDQCMDADLVDGSRVYIDASINRANAAKDSLGPALRASGQALFDALERAEADEAKRPPVVPATTSTTTTDASAVSSCSGLIASTVSRSSPQAPASPAPASPDAPSAPASSDASAPEPADAAETIEPVDPNARCSSTDPDARLTSKYNQTTLGYKDHRVVDDRFGIITVTHTTDAAAADASKTMDLLEEHERQTQTRVEVVAADKGYGEGKIYRELLEADVQPCIPQKAVREDKSKLPRKLFVFDPVRDCYTCPAGQTMLPQGTGSDGRRRYKPAAGVCSNCPLQSQCTDDKTHGRQFSRNVDQDSIDKAHALFTPAQRGHLMGRRRAVIEGSFADAANRHGYKRHRWRRLAGATIQNLLIATLQNLRKLLRYGQTPKTPPALLLPHFLRPTRCVERRIALSRDLQPSRRRSPRIGRIRSIQRWNRDYRERTRKEVLGNRPVRERWSRITLGCRETTWFR